MVIAPLRRDAPPRYTVADLDNFPDDGKLRELVAGQVVEWDVPNRLHGFFMAILAHLITSFVLEHRLGMVLSGDPLIRVQSSEHDARGPDICFYARGRAPRDLTSAVGDSAPDFVVEILSPGDRAGAVQRKVADWLRAGVRLLWYVDPETGSTTVYHAGSIASVGPDEELDGGDVLPGFRLRLRTIYDQLAALQEATE